MGNPIQFPTGTVTFLLTDIEGSTKLAQEYPNEMPELLARHKAILNQSIEKYHGFVFRTVGYSFSAAFDIAGDVLSAAREAQRRLQNACWSPALIRVRMGIHISSANVNMVIFPLGVQPFSMVHGKQIELSK